MLRVEPAPCVLEQQAHVDGLILHVQVDRLDLGRYVEVIACIGEVGLLNGVHRMTRR
jgi:hypothetical protein